MYATPKSRYSFYDQQLMSCFCTNMFEVFLYFHHSEVCLKYEIFSSRRCQQSLSLSVSVNYSESGSRGKTPHINQCHYYLIIISVCLFEGVEPKFLNQENDICLQVNPNINITFALHWVHCSLSTSEHFIKVVANNSRQEEQCRLSVTNNTCNVSDNTPACWCMSQTGPVTFTDRFTRAANITYVLQWRRGHEAKAKSVTVRVFEVSPTCGKNLYPVTQPLIVTQHSQRTRRSVTYSLVFNQITVTIKDSLNHLT